MLPAAFQTPAAVVLVAGGLLSCAAGYRLFRSVLGFFGFVIGALVVSSAMGADQTLWMIGAAILGGIVGAIVLVFAYFVGVALIGAGIGAGLVMAAWAAFGRDPGMIPMLVMSVLGAIGALALQRYVIIVSTAFGGAQTAIVGAAALMSARTAGAGAHGVFRVYPRDPLPGTHWDLAAWLALGTLGVIVQLAVTARGRK